MSQAESGLSLLNKSIQFHDPSSEWESFQDTLKFTQELPDNVVRQRKVYLDMPNQSMEFWASHEDGVIQYKVSNGKGSVLWNNSEQISTEIAEKYRLSNDRALMYRNYYTYLYGLPMKLKDPGTIIHEEVKKVEFYGKSYLKIKVTYEPEVGNDTWYFFFNPETFAMEAYQFYHLEEENDGEYILLDGIRQFGQLKIPRKRSWYTNKEEKFLATDILEY